MRLFGHILLLCNENKRLELLRNGNFFHTTLVTGTFEGCVEECIENLAASLVVDETTWKNDTVGSK